MSRGSYNNIWVLGLTSWLGRPLREQNLPHSWCSTNGSYFCLQNSFSNVIQTRMSSPLVLQRALFRTFGFKFWLYPTFSCQPLLKSLKRFEQLFSTQVFLCELIIKCVQNHFVNHFRMSECKLVKITVPLTNLVAILISSVDLSFVFMMNH